MGGGLRGGVARGLYSPDNNPPPPQFPAYYEIHRGAFAPLRSLSLSLSLMCVAAVCVYPLSFLSADLPLNCGGHWGTTDDFTTSFLHFLSSVLHCPLGLSELEACLFPDVVFPPLLLLLLLSALSSCSFHCALQDGFGQT